jgi:hypothetical protein
VAIYSPSPSRRGARQCRLRARRPDADRAPARARGGPRLRHAGTARFFRQIFFGRFFARFFLTNLTLARIGLSKIIFLCVEVDRITTILPARSHAGVRARRRVRHYSRAQEPIRAARSPLRLPRLQDPIQGNAVFRDSESSEWRVNFSADPMFGLHQIRILLTFGGNFFVNHGLSNFCMMARRCSFDSFSRVCLCVLCLWFYKSACWLAAAHSTYFLVYVCVCICYILGFCTRAPTGRRARRRRQGVCVRHRAQWHCAFLESAVRDIGARRERRACTHRTGTCSGKNLAHKYLFSLQRKH